MKSVKAAWPWLALALLAFAAWRVGGLALADHFAETDPERALFWRADHPVALLRAAELAAEEPLRAEEAKDYAERALAADPLDGRPYRVLAELALASGDEAQAAALFGFAARRSPRDLPSQAWLMQHHLRNERPAEALAHLDILLRVSPDFFTQAEPLLLALSAAGPVHQPLSELLARQPPWRLRFLRLVAGKATDLDAVAPLFQAVRQTEGGLAPLELGPWLDRLVREGRVGQAYLLWAANLPAERQTSLGNVFNGGFEFEPEPLGFDWRFSRVPGARIGRLSGEEVGGRMALRIAFEDRRVPFSHVRQMLALPPGRYQLSLRAKGERLRTERGLVWQISCATGGRGLGQTPPLTGHRPWHAVQLDFEVPEGCEGQWLLLRIPARIEAEQLIGGQAWFDDLKITRKP
ncbi:hypothetical protein [Arenimonas sp.]|uniref:hypothetical protein n=1 Tax=Arenimonas sp. TaxID=1872635 RepID=UPI0025D38505|nr:hypothetical protein [Arenimonas sp.]